MCFNQHDDRDPTNPSSGMRRNASAAMADRTYCEIAAILTEREGEEVSTQQVKQICRRAEKKLARALLADSSFPGESRR